MRLVARRLARLSAAFVIPMAVAGAALPAKAPAAARCAGADAAPSTLGRKATARATVCLLNRERRARGLRALVSDRRLARAARRHSRDMVARTYFAHVSPSGATCGARVARTGWLRDRERWMVGENLGWGSGTLATPRAIVAAWMASGAHRGNVLQPRFHRVGIGIALGAPVAGVAAPAATYTSTLGS
jgi:uncharacterized protein YkwD